MTRTTTSVSWGSLNSVLKPVRLLNGSIVKPYIQWNHQLSSFSTSLLLHRASPVPSPSPSSSNFYPPSSHSSSASPHHVTKTSSVILPETFPYSIRTPDLQSRQTRKLILPNGLHVYLISDPHSSSSGGALSVEVGSWRDDRK